MTTTLHGLRSQISDLYTATHGYLSTDRVDEEPSTRQGKRANSAFIFAQKASPLCHEIVVLRVTKEVTKLSEFPNVLETEMRYFESLRFISDSLETISQPLIASLKKGIDFEGTMQVIDSLNTPETLSIEKIQEIFRQWYTAYKKMGCAEPLRPISDTIPIERAIIRYNLEVAKEIQPFCHNLNLPIEGVGGELLPGITILLPAKIEIREAVREMEKIGHDSIRRIRFEFRRRIAILKENDLLVRVLDPTSPFSKTALSRRLENLHIRHDQIMKRFYSHWEKLSDLGTVLFEISQKTLRFKTDMVYCPLVNIGSIIDDIPPQEQESIRLMLLTQLKDKI